MSLGVVIALLGSSCTKSSPSVSPADSAGTSGQPLVSNLKDNYSFSLFYYALKKTGLDRGISGTGSYTLLVPDNDAFARDSILGDSDVDKLDTAYLRQWMAYHILPGVITTASVAQTINNAYPSITGQTLYFSKPVPTQNETNSAINKVLHINGDTVNTIDQLASNGVIQVLNRPLKLPQSSIQAYLSAQPRYSYFVSALQHFGLWDELTGKGPFTIWAPDDSAFISNGISLDSLNKIDTVHFQEQFMGIYVLTPARVFLTDFTDAPPTTAPSFYGGYLFFPNNGPYFYLPQSNGPGNFADYIGFDDYLVAQWVDPDVIAGNGVVQGINGLLILPSQATK